MKAALYVRVSTEAQTEKFSLPAQRRILTEYAERQKWEYEIYEDAGISGETLDARPAMQRLLWDVDAGRVGVALAVELTRFSRSRDLFDWLTIRKTFRTARIRWGTPQQLFSPDDPEDEFLTVLFGALSAREKQTFVARTKRGKDQAAREGRYVGSWRPYGYTVQDGRLLVKDDEAAVIRRIFQMNRDGLAIREIGRILTRERVPTPRQAIQQPGGRSVWAPVSVHAILIDPLCVGRAYYGKVRVVEGKEVDQPEDQWILVPAPRIVSDEEFTLAQRRTAYNAATAKRNKKRTYLLAGLIYCAACGSRLYGKVSGGGTERWRKPRQYYRCAKRCVQSRYVPAAEVEEMVWAEVVRGLQHPELVLAEARRQRESRFDRQDEEALRLETVRAALAKLPAERERVLLQHQEGYLDWQSAKGKLSDIKESTEALEEEAARLEGTLISTSVGREQEANMRSILERFGRRLSSLTAHEQRAVVRGFVQRVTVGVDGTVHLDSYLPRVEMFSRPG
jgi:site-specific DNA recombinase